MSVELLKVVNPVLKANVHYLVSDYKKRNNTRNHNGMDIIGKNRKTDYVIAIDKGVVITATYSDSAGYYVEIRHQNGYISRYLHLKKNSLQVKKGDVVKKGQVLGYMGSTGHSTGAHLHFAVYDQKKTPLDPLPYLLAKKNFATSKHDDNTDFIFCIQTALGAKVDGIPGKETFSKTITVSSKINHRHQVVKCLQSYLKKLGYEEIGNIDGIAGPKFTKAVKHFQKDNNCVVDGIITKKNKTWRKLLNL